uniref:CID domain-containing protein n=1 Tax=Rhodnius prolixus TaxID=13249 RepID=T1HK01_RHOPR
MNTFNEPIFEHKLVKLRGSHHSITNLSNWCLANHQHHERIVTIWLNVLKRVKIEHRVILFYLANDIIQYAKKKSLPFGNSFAPAFKKAVTMVREETVRPKIERLFSIWKQRGVYDEDFLEVLSGLLTRENTNVVDNTDFRPCAFYSRLRSFKQLEDGTKRKLMLLTQNPIPLADIEKMRKTFKERDAVSSLIPVVEEGLKKIKDYTSALEEEMKERAGLIELLESAESYFDAQHKEAKVVFNAYKWFGSRVKGVKRKLEECAKELPSPPLSPDINAPSPSSSSSPDESGGNDMPFCRNFTSGRSLMDGSSLAKDGLAKALNEENPGKVPSPALVYAAYNLEPAGSTICKVSSRFYPTVLPPQSMKLPQHIVYDHLADKSLPRNLHSPALLPTAYSSPRWAGSMTTSSPYSATPVLDHIEPKEHNVSPINSQGTTVEDVTRSQTLDDQNMTLSALLKSLFPGYGASETGKMGYK